MKNAEEIRFGRRDEGKVRSSTGLVLWASSIIGVSIHQLLPLGQDVAIGRLLGLVAISVLAASLSVWAQRFRSSKLVEAFVLATGCVALGLLVKWSGGAESVFIALYLFPMVYAAYFLRAKNAIAQIGFASMLAMAPLVYDAPGSSAVHLPSHLTVLLATFWGLSFAVGARKRELSRAERAARSEALTDPLTGVLNLRSFRAEAEDALVAAAKSGRPVTISIVDLDGLKAANAQHGHLGGDALIRAAAAVLERAARSDDCVARIGGDEFAVVLQGHGAGNVAGFERRLESLIDMSNHARAAGEAMLSLSVGSAVYPDDGFDLGELMAAADRRMYRVKETAGSTADADLQVAPAAMRPALPPDRIASSDSLTPRKAAEIAWVNWLVVTVVVAVSLLVPNADRHHFDVVLSLGGLSFAAAVATWIMARRRPVEARLLSDTISYLVIFPALYFTGADTAYLPLTLVPIAHAAYFLHRREAIARFFATVGLAGAPLLVFDDGQLNYASRFLALAFASAVIAYVLQSNRSALERAQQRASSLSRVDPLTGAANRRSFEEGLATLVRQAIVTQHAGKPASVPALVFIDLDDFKRVNTSLGHMGGDQVIKGAADALSKAAGAANLFFRVGGDEFAVVVSNATRDSVAEIAERCRISLHSVQIPENDKDLTHTTGSVGFALWTADILSATALMERADIALGNAKVAGKDSVWGEAPSPTPEPPVSSGVRRPSA